MILIVILLFGSVIGFNLFKQQKIAEYFANKPEPTYPVTSIKVTGSNWTPAIQAIGFIEPFQGVTIASQTAGIVNEILFKSGAEVSKGQVLVKLDTSVEEANLESSKARLPATESKYRRYADLLKKGSISKEAADEAQADYLSLVANIESLEATIARRNITAPFSGVVGIRNVDLGQYLQAGSEIVRLEDNTVMRLRFTVPQNDISKINIGQKINITIDAYPNSVFEGKITAIEPAVNFQSGLIQVQADIPNSHGELRSGMFARANVILPTQVNQVTLPPTAITYTLYGNNVYIIKEVDGVKRVKQHVVKTGGQQPNKVHILEGVEIGDTVVTSGQLRLSNDAKVKVVESDALSPDAQIPML